MIKALLKSEIAIVAGGTNFTGHVTVSIANETLSNMGFVASIDNQKPSYSSECSALLISCAKAGGGLGGFAKYLGCDMQISAVAYVTSYCICVVHGVSQQFFSLGDAAIPFATIILGLGLLRYNWNKLGHPHQL
jgi:hypothetical protein